CNNLWGRSSFARCLIEINSEADVVDVVTIGIPYLIGNDFTKKNIRVVSPLIVTTSNVVTPTIEKTNDGFQTVGNTSKSSSSLKTIGTSSKNENISMSNSYLTLNDKEDDEEEEVENVYDESYDMS
nr:hypothetical protein [Tanacetum cinerariifolium]